MSTVNTIKSKVVPSLRLDVEEKSYTVEFPISAVVKAEEALGRKLMSVQDWLRLEWKDIPAVLHAGLQKRNPEVAIEEVTRICEALGAEGCLEIKHALICLNFPRTMEAYEQQLRSGKISPNA